MIKQKQNILKSALDMFREGVIFTQSIIHQMQIIENICDFFPPFSFYPMKGMSCRSSQKDSFTETKYKFWSLRPNHTFEIVVHGHAFLLSSFLVCGLAWTWCIWRWLLQTICQSQHRFVACITRRLTSGSLCYIHVSDDDSTMRETEWWSEGINEWVSKWMNEWVCLLHLFVDKLSFFCSIVVTGDLCIIPPITL